MEPNFEKTFDVRAEGAFKSYKRLIEESRRQLADTFSHDVPILPPRRSGRLPFFHVVLRAKPYAVTLWIRADDLYMVGYRVGDAGPWLEMPEEGVTRAPHLIAGSTFLSFDGGYTGLARAAHRGRLDTPLGREPLTNAVNQLATATSIRHDGDENRARAVTVVIQMICESIRFHRISDYLADSFREYTPPPAPLPAPSWMQDLENGWSDLSGAVRRAEADPMIPPYRILPPNDMGIQTLVGAREALGIMLGTMEFSGLNRFPRMAVAAQSGHAQGRPLVEVFSVCINDISGEDPGDLYGTIKVTDGLHCQYIYNRGREAYELIRRGGTALLIGPSCAISAEGSFTIDLALSDRAVIPPDDPVSTGLISWNVYHTTNVYDTPLSDEVGARYGSATVNYIVLSDAVEAAVEVTLIDGDGKSAAADVYGLLTARNTKFMNESVLFRKARGEAIGVGPGQLITLSRAVVAVPFHSSLVVRADLKYRDRLKFDDEIAKGTAEFPVQPHASCDKYISGKYGKIKVTVSWG